MVKTSKINLLWLLSLCSLFACVGATSENHVIRQTDMGETVQMEPGETLTVILEGNLTTGYSWEVVEADPTVLKPVGEPEYISESELLGSGGEFRFSFFAVNSGQTDLKIIYHRLWEEDVVPLEVFEIPIVVR